MAIKNHHEGFDGTVDSSDLATILRERQKANTEAYPSIWTHNRPRTWAEAVRSIFKREPLFHPKHH